MDEIQFESEPSFYRICVVTVPGLFQIRNQEQCTNGKTCDPHDMLYDGNYAFFGDSIRQYLPKNSLNWSLVMRDSMGNRESDASFSGCYGSVYDNTSDFALGYVQYPTHDYKKVFPFQILKDYKVQILSAYTVKDTGIKYADFFRKSFDSFQLEVWIVVLMSFIAFCSILWIRKKVLGTNECKSTIFEAFCHFTGSNLIDFSGKSGNQLSLTMTVAFFLISVFYLNLMSTDLVILEKPVTMNSYQDLMNFPDMTPGFIEAMPDINEFRDETNNESIQWKFWQKFKYKHALFRHGSFDPVNTSNRIYNAAEKGNHAFVTNELLTKAIKTLLCKIKLNFYPAFKDTHSWVATDSQAKTHIMTMIMRQVLREVLLSRYFRKIIRALVEVGIFDLYLNIAIERFDFANVIEVMDYSHTPFNREGQAAYIRKCYSSKVNYNRFHIEKAVPQNYRMLTYSCVFLLSVAILTLLYEKGILRYVLIFLITLFYRPRIILRKIRRRFKKLFRRKTVHPIE